MTPPDWPADFRAFQASRTRFLDRLAAGAVLGEIEREAASARRAARNERPMEPLVVEGELSVLTDERRLVFGDSAPSQRDLADVVRDRAGAGAQAFGVAHVGRVRITIESLPAGGA